MLSRQALYLSQRFVHHLRIERPAPLEERLFITEIAGMRAAARDDDRIRHQVQVPFNQITADGRHHSQRPDRGAVNLLWKSSPEISQESRPGIFSGTDEDRIGVLSRLFRQ